MMNQAPGSQASLTFLFITQFAQVNLYMNHKKGWLDGFIPHCWLRPQIAASCEPAENQVAGRLHYGIIHQPKFRLFLGLAAHTY